jgi:hypothetical protein
VRLYGSDDAVLSAFKNHELVYVAGKWIGLKNCRWSAPQSLSNVVSIGKLYADQSALFQKTLQVKDADAADTVDEICRLAGNRSLGTIQQLLVDLCKSTWTNDELASLKRIKTSNAAVFPVRSVSDALELRSIGDTSWFIADRVRLKNTFKGAIGMIEVDELQFKAMAPLMGALELKKRFLSLHVQEQTETTGNVSFQQGPSNGLRSKAASIALLVDSEHHSAVEQQLAAIELWSAEGLILRRHVMVGSRKIHGADEDGWILIDEVNGALRVYVSEDAMTENDIPWKDICDHLMSYCRIDVAKGTILFALLTTNNKAALERILDQADLRPDALATSDEDMSYIIDNKPDPTAKTAANQKPSKSVPSDGAPASPIVKDPVTKANVNTNPTLPRPGRGTPQPTATNRSSGYSVPLGNFLDVKKIENSAKSFNLETTNVSNASVVTGSGKTENGGSHEVRGQACGSDSAFNTGTLNAALSTVSMAGPRSKADMGHVRGKGPASVYMPLPQSAQAVE